MSGYLTHFNLKKAKTPYIDVLPPLSKSVATALKESIEQNGVEKPITVDPDGNILDGHNRQKYKPDCPFTIKADLNTDAEKRAFVFAQGAVHRQMTVKEQKDYREKMKPTAASLRKQGLTQEQTAAMLGVSRTKVQRWEAPNSSNARVRITRSQGRPAKVSPEQVAVILSRLATGETQEAVANDFGISDGRVLTTRTRRQYGWTYTGQSRESSGVSNRNSIKRREWFERPWLIAGTQARPVAFSSFAPLCGRMPRHACSGPRGYFNH